MADIEKIKQDLDGLTLLEAAELVKMLEEAWGVSAAAPVAMAAAPGAGGGGGGAAGGGGGALCGVLTTVAGAAYRGGCMG
ncbi:MAG: hypothetical protein F4Y37_07325, partial [Caldilineaceae bacterium SB0664_bin_22]|nr:hypothetical protein [Caldilineaceae bacterium SB0664_bin_22]